jgi:hypothetical protein
MMRVSSDGGRGSFKKCSFAVVLAPDVTTELVQNGSAHGLMHER